MGLREWDDLPINMNNEEVRKYYDLLFARKQYLIGKRVGDLIIALVLLVLFAIPMLIVMICIRADSSGKVIFKQRRITTYGKPFFIYKFRTMRVETGENDPLITRKKDERITRVGRILRKYHLDELPQIFNVIRGDMTLVGTRPEVEQFVRTYSNEMYATLLLPAGITSKASILFQNESELLAHTDRVEQAYCEKILPMKMKVNLQSLEEASFRSDLKVLVMTMSKVWEEHKR